MDKVPEEKFTSSRIHNWAIQQHDGVAAFLVDYPFPKRYWDVIDEVIYERSTMPAFLDEVVAMGFARDACNIFKENGIKEEHLGMVMRATFSIIADWKAYIAEQN